MTLSNGKSNILEKKTVGILSKYQKTQLSVGSYNSEKLHKNI